MKGIKIELLGIAIIPLGIAVTTNNFWGYVLGCLLYTSLPVWLILFVIGLAVKMTVQTYAVVRGILGFIFTLLIIATAYCYHDWVQVAFLFSLSVILYLILFAGVFIDTVLDMTRESIIDFILS